jgi:hypothetical protein
LYRGDRDGCHAALGRISGYYVYVLRRPDGTPFYVGKGTGFRAFAHENEARHPNGPTSNAHKLNVIRAMKRRSESILYELDAVFPSEDAAYARETALITTWRRLHEGGTLTNRAPGGGSTAGVSPFSKEKHAATLGGIPEDDPDTAKLNRFVLAIGRMDSVVLKPTTRFRPRPTLPHPSPRKPSLRQAVALAATAAANGVVLTGGARLPRSVEVEEVRGFVENGVSCDIAKSGMARVLPAPDPAQEVFMLDDAQARAVIGFIGLVKAANLGIAP